MDVTIHNVLRNGCKEEILEKFQHNIDLDNVDDNGDTLLHAVLRNENLTESDIIDIITVLLAEDANPNIKNENDVTVLHLAISKRMKNVVSIFLKFDADINVVDEDGDTLAHFFVNDECERFHSGKWDLFENTVVSREEWRYDSLKFLRYLISNGFDFGRKNNQGESALYLAITCYLQYFLPTLFKYTNDLKIARNDDRTLPELLLEISTFARKSRFLDDNSLFDYDSRYVIRSMEILCERGLSLPMYDKYGRSLIWKTLEDKNDIKIIETMIDYYLKNCNDNNFSTTLFCELVNTCAMWSHAETEYFLTVISDLVARGVNVNQEIRSFTPCQHGKSALQIAVGCENMLMIQALIDLGADVNSKDRNSQTPLHEAGALNESLKLVELLVRSGADASVSDFRGDTPLHFAASNANVSVVRFLIEHGASVNSANTFFETPLHRAVSIVQASAEIVELLIERGADVKAQDRRGNNPLMIHCAVPNANVSIVRSLVECGASVECRDKYQLETALHRAVKNNAAAEIIELLLASGADPNAIDSKGNRPIHLTTSDTNASTVRLLIEHGASVNCQTSFFMQTPLHRAVAENQAVDIIKLLLDNEADVNAKDNKGNTPLLSHLTVGHANESVVRLLINYGAYVNDRNRIMETPLHLIVVNDGAHAAEVVALLLENGASITAKDYNGNTPLHRLFDRSSLKTECSERILEMLLINGSHVSTRNNEKKSVLTYSRSAVGSYAASGQKMGIVLSQHGLKFKAAELPLSREYQAYVAYRDDPAYYGECLTEIQLLKSRFIDGNTSLHAFLHMNAHRRVTYINNEKLLQLIESPNFSSQFPKYFVLIMSSYRDALGRKILLKSAEEAWYELVKVELPDCLYQIFAYLTNEDLIHFTEANIS